MILLDTPGVIDQKRNRLESRMMSFVKSSMRQADGIVAIVDITRSAQSVLDMIQPPPNYSGPPILVVLNKIDRCETKSEVEEAEVRPALFIRLVCPEKAHYFGTAL
jgi:GTPase Era involved in 16S rRNA processing